MTPERVQIAVRWVLLAIVLGCWLRKTGLPCSTSERAFLFILEPRRLETLWGCYLWVEGGEVRVLFFFPPPTQIVRKLRVHKEQLSGVVGVSCNSCKSLINAKERRSEAGCCLRALLLSSEGLWWYTLMHSCGCRCSAPELKARSAALLGRLFLIIAQVWKASCCWGWSHSAPLAWPGPPSTPVISAAEKLVNLPPSLLWLLPGFCLSGPEFSPHLTTRRNKMGLSLSYQQFMEH